MASLAEIERYAERIAREFRPERIVLFGSHALGAAREDSDVDLLVVMPHRGKSWDQAAEIRSRLRPTFPLDLLVRSPETLHERLELGDPLFVEIATTGRVLHEAVNE
ncbi:MAG TPA: nucleotidyltransferase domain-containing protein [Thermoanaerobaculia bacterium]|nr:nucleotidyltransferase domain-containing protein [Thermoanaerobaculia bacterium]